MQETNNIKDTIVHFATSQATTRRWKSSGSSAKHNR